MLPGTKLFDHSASIETKISETWLDFLKKYRISWKNKWRWIRMQKLYYKPALYYPIVRFLFYEPVGIEKFHKTLKKAK